MRVALDFNHNIAFVRQFSPGVPVVSSALITVRLEGLPGYGGLSTEEVSLILARAEEGVRKALDNAFFTLGYGPPDKELSNG